MTDPATQDAQVAELTAEIAALRRQVNVLETRLRRVDRDLASTKPVVEAVRALTIWDHTPYGLNPGTDWVAVDRGRVAELLAALAGVDHWTPWQTPLEPRPH
ncbi:hypothetical protein JTZ10_20110 [Gordonia rubripertincta]|uniref:Uncharacterized protein n=1 Tax=Gordonia rubripertincta TaxID=36822 RepID=A0AAW4G8L8_GORRU|nr:hypothetical protein [Gordonia rubripertincta]MBM7280056.1 hypothetical protein [Gordonia rubripertincta]QMU21989.1 hypothetical protein H3V45_05715 [Gordonia rubripertincta]